MVLSARWWRSVSVTCALLRIASAMRNKLRTIWIWFVFRCLEPLMLGVCLSRKHAIDNIALTSMTDKDAEIVARAMQLLRERSPGVHKRVTRHIAEIVYCLIQDWPYHVRIFPRHSRTFIFGRRHSKGLPGQLAAELAAQAGGCYFRKLGCYDFKRTNQAYWRTYNRLVRILEPQSSLDARPNNQQS